MRSPLPQRVTSVLAIAAMPLLVIKAASAPSRRATCSAAALTVGLRKRVYQSSFSPPVSTTSS